MAHWGTFGESKISNIFSNHSLNDYKENDNRWRIIMKRIKILIPIFLIAILFSSCFGSKKILLDKSLEKFQKLVMFLK